MARYIDVDKAIESINRILIEKENEKSSTAYFAFEKFKELLETAPTADVVPTSELDRVMREKTTLECIVATARNIARTDTVKKMQERVESYIDVGHYRSSTELCFSESDVVNIIRKIAKEMLEGNDGH